MPTYTEENPLGLIRPSIEKPGLRNVHVSAIMFKLTIDGNVRSEYGTLPTVNTKLTIGSSIHRINIGVALCPGAEALDVPLARTASSKMAVAWAGDSNLLAGLSQALQRKYVSEFLGGFTDEFVLPDKFDASAYFADSKDFRENLEHSPTWALEINAPIVAMDINFDEKRLNYAYGVGMFIHDHLFYVTRLHDVDTEAMVGEILELNPGVTGRKIVVCDSEKFHNMVHCLKM